MITIEKCNTGAFTPENNAEANGEIMGRCNALHDVLLDIAKVNAKSEWRKEPLDSDLRLICLIMGFTDALAVEMEQPEEKEKASDASAD